jgi:hypothetical protein
MTVRYALKRGHRARRQLPDDPRAGRRHGARRRGVSANTMVVDADASEPLHPIDEPLSVSGNALNALG